MAKLRFVAVSSPPPLVAPTRVATSRPSALIVGAGPAGTAAAIRLASHGADVTMLDKAEFPRDKCCGDGLTSGALRLLQQLGVEPENIASWRQVDHVEIRSPAGRYHSFELPSARSSNPAGQFAAVATRTDFDNALVRRARACGAVIHEGTELLDAALTENGVRVATSTGSFVADWLIAADGMWSPTRKMLGLGGPTYLGEWHAFRQYWTNVAPIAQERLFVWFEPDLLPGYVWSFPLADGRANVGFGVLRGTKPTGYLKQVWPDIVERPHIRAVLGPDAVPQDRHLAWPIPARVGDLPLTAHRTFFVGDAAAACDPLTGEGIGQALQTGMTAADSILAGLDPASAAHHYRQRVDRELGVDMRLAARLGSALAKPTMAEASLGAAGATDWTRRNFVRWLFEDYPRAIVGTPRRWTKDIFSRPGAWADARTAS